MTSWWTFLVDHDLGGFSCTAGSQSWRTWRHKYMTHKVLIDMHDDALKLARDAVCGGRCQAYKVGALDGPWTQLDVNSAYASCMQYMDVPVKLISYTEHADWTDLLKWMEQRAVIADVDVLASTDAVPSRVDGKLAFRGGSFRTVLCGAELQYALRHYTVQRVHRVATYEKAPAFSSYMTAIWHQRMHARAAHNFDEEDKWKLLGNSFYGKWAQRGGWWENCDRTEDMSHKYWVDVDLVDHVVHEFRQLGGLVQEKSRELESRESSPAIAAYIAAEARMNLWWLIQDAGKENVAYVDTDALLVNTVGLGKLHHRIAPNELGALKAVGTYDRVRVFGKKNYQLDSHLVRAGLRHDAVELGDSAVRQDARQSVARQIHSGESLGARSETVTKNFNKKKGG